MEKAMAPHSSTVAWKIPWKEKPGRLQSMGSHRVGHDWSDAAAAAAAVCICQLKCLVSLLLITEIIGFSYMILLIFLNKLIYFNWRLITLQYCSGFCRTLTWISHGCTCVPILNPLPTSFLIPSLRVHPSAPALSTLSHALNLDWRSISHMIIYMFQRYSLKSSHPRLLPQSPKVCSLHLCLFCCFAYRVIVTIFLNSIYMC